MGVVGEPRAWAIASINSRSSPPTYIEGDYRVLQSCVCGAGAIARAKVLGEYSSFFLPQRAICLSLFEWSYNTLETFRSLGACVISV